MKNIYFLTEDEVICLDKVVHVKKEKHTRDGLGLPINPYYCLKIAFEGNYLLDYGFSEKEERDQAFESLVEAMKEREKGDRANEPQKVREAE